jgi:outer membrane autotransporter protein
MKSRQVVAVVLALGFWLAGLLGMAEARDVEPVVLPPGSVVVVYTADEANGILIGQGRNTPTTKSWDGTGSVSQVKSGQVEHYVRVFTYDASRLKGGAVGSWMMRASSLRGLTAQSIKDIFALPTLPTYVTCIRVPTGTNLWTGTAGSITGWGDGGAQQMMLIDRIDSDNYTYQRELGQNALRYAPQVADNPYRVGGYLDHLPKVTAYSDLEYVYNMLDYLAPSPLASALEQIGPSRYDALNRLALAEVAGLHQAIAARAHAQLTEQPDQNPAQPNLWVRLLGSVGRQSESGGLIGWRYKTSTLLAGMDYAGPQHLLLGLALGLAYSDLSFDNGLGDAQRTTPLASLYSAWVGGPWDMSLALTGGPASVNMKRNLTFSELSRSAAGHPDGYVLATGLNAGYSLPLGDWRLRPQAGLDLLQYHQQSLTETGAAALNLRLNDYSAATARTSLGASLSRTCSTSASATLTPAIGLAWTYTTPLNSRSLTSSLADQSGSFSTQGDTGARHGINPSLSITLNSRPNLNFTLACSSEIREDLVAHSAELGVMWKF